MKREKTHDGVKILSKLSGISEAGVKTIWEEVKRNQKALDACEGPHRFKKTGEGLRANYICEKCGGIIERRYHKMYEQGLYHGRNEVHKGDTAQGRISHLQGILCAVSSAFGMDGTHEKLKAEIDDVLGPDKSW